MTTRAHSQPATAPYRIVVLDDNNEPKRTLYRSQHYAAVLGFLSRNLDARPNLDMMRGREFVAWELTPPMVGAEGPAKTIMLPDDLSTVELDADLIAELFRDQQ